MNEILLSTRYLNGQYTKILVTNCQTLYYKIIFIHFIEACWRVSTQHGG
ncbi:hypothetical protein AO377_1928 [Moraxella catarrhalis]|nr:hypothetical protein AO380_1821 [Moraxella catarrhalis]OAV08153.1 hypothetical protein AO377_1928 [Moraxella catarrhalis]OAV11536.1 hypothetical protein AO378_0239 [Moraxella catarrhalis]OAV30050.1 hypothetical protein AO367_1500 [Moraxella catarrhalis]OAV34039.1 hypothetical protein AO365_1587 [Moraxella catarrhalis]